MKLLPPDMKSRNNFMTGRCEFHVAEKVDFPDECVTVKDNYPKKQTNKQTSGTGKLFCNYCFAILSGFSLHARVLRPDCNKELAPSG
jgi:hypothetical protein